MSSLNQSTTELQMPKITYVRPYFAKPFVVRSPFSSVIYNVGLCPTACCCLCVGLVALLHFLSGIVCRLKMQMCYQKRWLYAMVVLNTLTTLVQPFCHSPVLLSSEKIISLFLKLRTKLSILFVLKSVMKGLQQMK